MDDPLSIRFLVDETLPRRDYFTLVVLLGVLAVGSVAASAASLVRGHLFARVEAQVLSDMRFELFHQLQHLPPAYFGKTPGGEILSRSSNDLGAVGTRSLSSQQRAQPAFTT